MNLVASVFGTMKEMYRGLNPATLTGAIDVIVVRQPDGSLQCSPFHVRFGKLGVLRSKEKVVDIEINGEPVDLHMKLGDNGEAFFVEENEDLESDVPAHLCTSPIPLEPEEQQEPVEGATPSLGRRKKRRKKRVRSDCPVRDESSSEEREESESPQHHEQSPVLQTSKSIYYSMCEDLEQPRDAHAHSDSEQSPNENVLLSRPSSPKSDSELCVRPRGSSGPEIQWNWGGFPTPCQSQRSPVHTSSCSSSSHFRTIKRQDSFDLGIPPPTLSSVSPRKVTVVRPKARTRSLDLNNCFPQPHLSKPANEPHTKATISTFNSRFSNFSLPNGDKTETDGIAHVSSKPEKVLIQNGGNNEDSLYQHEEENGQISARVNGGEDGESLKEEILDDNFQSVVNIEASFNNDGEEASDSTAANENAAKSETQDKKEKRSQHLGTSDIYLDDLTSMDPGVALLYFPKTGKEASQPAGASSLSGSLSPQSVGSGMLDSGTDYLSDSASFSADVSLSLCGPGDSSAISKEKFEERMVTYQDFSSNPGLVDDPNLVVCINSTYYNWAVAGPMVLAMAAFQKNLPKSTVEQLVKDKMSKKSGRWWFPFRRRDLSHSQKNSKEDPDGPVSSLPPTVQATLDDVDSDEAAGLGRFASLPSTLSSDGLSTTQSFSHMYRKSLRLTSKQIEQLNLCEGENSAVFSVTTQYQGTCRCEASIFLWSWDDRVIISDIDGTITKSDALGHLLTTIGADWTHFGIAKLYHRIHQNGYRLLYCSARAIGMSAWTKEYLSRVNDRGNALPKGPVLLAPSSLVSALHREVIEKKPEVFKVACLSDIRDLFNPHREPFYAAFGNRTNDAFAYKAVGVPETRIFTVNPRGELIQEKSRSNKSSYPHLCELVEHFFPPLCTGSEVLDCPDFSSATYWKEPLPPLDLDALL
ncbi:phosphatidate phosphatase LPIN3-like [Periophthalmus magnuspinnatus]|uniref:phosphatidate phosphatase LPIN3-like n=1 Tax=Periophthalmus magnuspinnatus TaxID=409849 RepID=UPI00145A2105|nr:phosphatidate phosphatase LPIN3-like [Periophthalmus magnuspinnatus]XP_055077770.1 phosphatidate phosphatase LPIN3-like [Periophthalmus magnuspinnatus]